VFVPLDRFRNRVSENEALRGGKSDPWERFAETSETWHSRPNESQ